MFTRLCCARRARFVVSLGAALSLTAGCASFQAPRAIPLPANAIAVAQLAHGRVAVLAGDGGAKAISVINLANGAVVASFGVTREATGIAAESPDGPLLVAVGGVADGEPFGAIERWSLIGLKGRVVPLPARALGMTRMIDGVAYALLAGDGEDRAAVSIQSPALRIGSPIGLEASARNVQQCKIGALDYLVYADGGGRIVLRGAQSGRVLRSEVVADSPECDAQGNVYAIRKQFAASSIVVMEIPALLQIAQLPVSNDARALYATDDRQIMALDSTSRVASLEVVHEPAAVKTAAR